MSPATTPRPGPARQPRPPAFDREVHKRRDMVERRFNRLKRRYGIAIRHDRTAESCRAAVTLTALLMRA